MRSRSSGPPSDETDGCPSTMARRSLCRRAVGSLTGPRSGHSATLLQDGWVLLAGGHSTMGRSSHSATLLDDGRVLIAGGEHQADVLASAELYDPSTGTFRTIAPERPWGCDMRSGYRP